MRAVLLAVVAVGLAACGESFEDRTNRRLDTGEGDAAKLAGRVAELEKKVAQLEAAVGAVQPDPNMPAMVDSLAKQLADVKAAVAKLQPQKQVYLVARAGTPDEKLIGLNTGGGCAWSMELGGEICFATNFEVYYSNADCTGDAFISPSRYVPDRLVRAADGSVYSASPSSNEFAVKAFQTPPSGPCTTTDSKLVAHPLKPIGTMPKYDPGSDLSKTLR